MPSAYNNAVFLRLLKVRSHVNHDYPITGTLAVALCRLDKERQCTKDLLLLWFSI